MRRDLPRFGLLLLSACLTQAQPVALSVNSTSREEVRQFYRTIFHASEGIPMDWTGSYATGAAGDTSAAFKEATRLRINFYRALVGVPADISFSPAYNARNQQAALLMSVNNDLSHTPPPSWMGYTTVAADAALNSNLALGHAGPDAITGYVADAGDNNAIVGHRRWLFYPQTLQMGTGDVPGIPGNPTRRAANTTWVIDGQYGSARPTTRTTAVTYPPSGFVPHQLVWPRWSFSHPDAEFASATVSMTRDGESVVTRLEPLGTNVGEPTLVWVYDNLNPDSDTAHARPGRDVTYTVTVNNVRIRGAAQNFVYHVTVFDPDVPSADAMPVRVTGAALPTLGASNAYTVAKPAFAAGFEWRSVQLTPITRTFTAETGLEDLLATTTAGYDVVQGATVATGSRAYRLAQFASRTDQVLRLPGTYLASPDSVLTFQSRLSIATAIETARVQVSGDDGRTWVTVFAQSGTSATNTNMPTATESAFVTRTLPLTSFSGQTLAIRFIYSAGSGTIFIPDATNTVGWFIDDLSLTNVQLVAASPANRVSTGSTFTFTPSAAGPVGLQARGLMFDAYPMQWDAVTPVNVVASGPSGGASYLSNLSVRTNAGSGAETLIVGFAVSGGTKQLLVRGVGPGLGQFGITNALGDPRLELYREAAKIGENDNWNPDDAATFGRVGAFSLPNNSRDAAMVVSLNSGSYTAQVSGSGGSGLAIVELYDTAPGTSAKLANVSARTRVGSGDETLIAGFNVSGTGNRTLLIRGIGPALVNFGVEGTLADPKLELFGRDGSIQQNDNWEVSTRAAFSRVGAFDLPANSRDAVLLVTLPPGSYTAQLSGVNGASGVALVEVYELP